MTVRNRIVMSPMETMYGTPEGLPSQRTVAYFAARAAGGVGLITVGATGIDHRHPETPGRAADRRPTTRVDAHRGLVDAVHEHGARIQPQIVHAGPDGLGPEMHGVDVARAVGDPVVPHRAAVGRDHRRSSGDDPRPVPGGGRAGPAGGVRRPRAARRARLHVPRVVPGAVSATGAATATAGRSVEGRIRVVLEALAAIRAEVGARLPDHAADLRLRAGGRRPTVVRHRRRSRRCWSRPGSTPSTSAAG